MLLSILAIVAGLALLSLQYWYVLWMRRLTKTEARAIRINASVWFFVAMLAGMALVAGGAASIRCNLLGAP